MRDLRKEYQQAIEEKDETFTLSNNDLQDIDKDIKPIKYQNFGLQRETNAKDYQIENAKIPSKVLQKVMFIIQETQAQTMQ